jgi:hypothetical protein
MKRTVSVSRRRQVSDETRWRSERLTAVHRPEDIGRVPRSRASQRRSSRAIARQRGALYHHDHRAVGVLRMSRSLPTALLSAVVPVGCASPAASPTPRSLASTSPSFGPSGEALQTPTQSFGTPGTTGGPSGPPATRAPAWHATGKMISPHAFHASTSLRDGSDLLVGGKINDGPTGTLVSALQP